MTQHYFYPVSESANAAEDAESSENQTQIELKEDDGDDWDVDPATLIERGNRKGSRFATDGTPLCLKSFLESGSPGTFVRFFQVFYVVSLLWGDISDATTFYGLYFSVTHTYIYATPVIRVTLIHLYY